MSSSFLRAFSDLPAWPRAGFWLLAAAAGIVPLFTVPWAQDAFVLPKETLIAGLSLMAFAVWLAGACRGQALRVALAPLPLLVALIPVWMLISALWADAPALALDQARRWGAWALLAIAAQGLLAGDRRRLLALATLVWGASVVVAAWALILDFINAFGGGMNVRAVLGDWRDVVAVASMGNTGHVADFIVMGFLLGVAALATVRSPRALMVVLGGLWLQAAALIAAWSVHSNASLLLAVGLWVWLLRDQRDNEALRRRVVRRLAMAAAGWALVVAFFVVDHPMNPHGSRVWAGENADARGGIFSQAFASERWQAGGETRLGIWLITLEIVRTHPLLGVGAGNFTHAFPATISPLAARDPDLDRYHGTWTNAAHNDPLQVWSETGVVGLFLFAALVAAVFHAMATRAVETSRGNRLILATASAMLAAMMLQGLMSFPLELPVPRTLLALLVAVPVILPPRGGVWDLMMPVRRSYPGLQLGIMLKNMQTPTEFRAESDLGPRGNAALAWAFIAVGALAAAWAQAPLAASLAYRPVYEQIRAPGFPRDDNAARVAVERLRGVLAIDGGFVDARSALTDLLVRSQRWEEAIVEGAATCRRLNATEVWVREGVAQDALGNDAAARRAWAEVFRRQPAYALDYPAPFARWQFDQSRSAPGQSPTP